MDYHKLAGKFRSYLTRHRSNGTVKAVTIVLLASLATGFVASTSGGNVADSTDKTTSASVIPTDDTFDRSVAAASRKRRQEQDAAASASASARVKAQALAEARERTARRKAAASPSRTYVAPAPKASATTAGEEVQLHFWLRLPVGQLP
jgi:hypothetical protein